MKTSIIIAHDPRRSPALLNRAVQSINHERIATGILSDSELIIETEGSISAARNSAVQRSSGEFLIFLDDDMVLRRGFLSEILDPFVNEKVGIVGGVNVAFPNHPASEEISAVLYSSVITMARSVARYSPRGNIQEADESMIIACCMAVRRTAFLEAGGFPLDVIPCEENVLINRIQSAGWKVIYNPFAVVFHRRAQFPGEYARAIFHYGKGRGKMLRMGKGAPKMLWKPSRKWLYLFSGIIIHYCSYISGVVWGYLKLDEWRKDET